MWTHAGIRINGGKTRVWNRSGSQQRGCDIFQRIAVQSDTDAVVWRGSDVPTVQQGIKILGTPLGTTITCRTNWKGLPMSTNASWTCCLQSRTSSRVGCFLCIAHQPGRTTCCALCAQTVCGVLLRHTSPSAFWASWADCLPMISARHPAVADMIIRELDGHPVTPCLSAASRIARDLVGVGGFE